MPVYLHAINVTDTRVYIAVKAMFEGRKATEFLVWDYLLGKTKPHYPVPCIYVSPANPKWHGLYV